MDPFEDPRHALPPPVQTIRVTTDKRRYGKIMTVIEGLDPKEVDVRALAKRLKNLVAAGGTFDEGRIELQGDHRARVIAELRKEEFVILDS